MDSGVWLGVLAGLVFIFGVIGFLGAKAYPNEKHQRAQIGETDLVPDSRTFLEYESARIWVVAVGIAYALAGSVIGALAWLLPKTMADFGWPEVVVPLLAVLLLFAIGLWLPNWFRQGRQGLTSGSSGTADATREPDDTRYPLRKFTWRTTATAVIVAGPIAAAVFGIATVGIKAAMLSQDSTGGYSAADVVALEQLRRYLFVYLALAITLSLALLVITALIQRALKEYDPGRWTAAYKSLDVPLFGGLFTAVFAAAFFPSYAALRATSWQVVETVADQAGWPRDADWFESRKNLIDALSLNTNLTAVFAGAIAIASPLLTASLTRYLRLGAEQKGQAGQDPAEDAA